MSVGGYVRMVLMVAGALFLVLVLAVGGFVAWWLWATYSGAQKAYQEVLGRTAAVSNRLAAGQDPDAADLQRFASDRVTRGVLYDTLEAHQKLHLFPSAYRTQEALAEADLVLWLVHPNELAAPPDEIQLMSTVPTPGQSEPASRYYLFRFRTHEPHWAAADGWMAGVAGPYDDGRPTFRAPGTFSRFESYESRTPEEHVRVTHETTHR